MTLLELSVVLTVNLYISGTVQNHSIANIVSSQTVEAWL
jgi:hypothetical protein